MGGCRLRVHGSNQGVQYNLKNYGFWVGNTDLLGDEFNFVLYVCLLFGGNDLI